MPKTTRNLNRQTMAQLAGEHNNLPAMMTFMRHEIRKNMPDIKRKVAPNICRGGGNCAASITTEPQQPDNAAATLTQCRNQLLRRNLVSIDGSRRRDAEFFS